MQQLTSKEEQKAGGRVDCIIHETPEGVITMAFGFAGKTTPEKQYPNLADAKAAAQKFAQPYGEQFVFGGHDYDPDFGGATTRGQFIRKASNA